MLKRLRSQIITLLFTASAGALLFHFSKVLGVAFTALSLLILLRPKYAALATSLYILFSIFSLNSFFVLDYEVRGGKTLYRTTKGYFELPKADVGDLFIGKLSYDKNLKKWLTTGAMKRSRVPLTSYLLEKRIIHSKSLNFRSGAKINTTQAHLFAVRSYIPEKINDEYIITGLAHLIAMSGFHVVVFSGGLFLLFFFLPFKVRIIPCALLLPLLIPLSGFTVTVVRAVIFSAAYLAAIFLDLKIRPVSFVALAASIVLILSPESLFSISFMLSFWAVLGIAILFKQSKNPAIAIVQVGLASSLFTLPLQLYYFGTANLLSVVTTVIMTPIVWTQMLFGIASLFIMNFMIVPLSLVEEFAAFILEKMYDISWVFLYVAKPPALLLLTASASAFALCFTRAKYFALLLLLVPLLPVYPKNILIFPELHPSQKGYVLIKDGKSEIFFQGMRSTFVYKMVPEAARLGIKTFDYGRIRLFDGTNLYLKINDEEGRTGIVCVNSDDGCPYMYSTRSNTLKAPLNPATKQYIIYNNKEIDERIILQKERGALEFSP